MSICCISVSKNEISLGRLSRPANGLNQSVREEPVSSPRRTRDEFGRDRSSLFVVGGGHGGD